MEEKLIFGWGRSQLFGSFFCAVVGSLKSHQPIVGTLTHDGWNFEIPSASSPEEMVFVSAARCEMLLFILLCQMWADVGLMRAHCAILCTRKLTQSGPKWTRVDSKRTRLPHRSDNQVDPSGPKWT